MTAVYQVPLTPVASSAAVPIVRPLKTRRIDGFDAARGAAMFMVCLSHFMGVYFGDVPYGWAGRFGQVTLIASPTFIALSGIMFGLLTTAGDARSQILRLKLADRALFLLVAAHALLVVSRIPSLPLTQPIRWFGPAFVTDAIAVSILVSFWVVPLVSARVRATLAVVMLAFCWMLIVAWHPMDSFDIGLKEVLVGSLSYQLFPYSWALVPWLSAYLLCTALGEVLGTHFRSGEHMDGERLLLIVWLTMTALGLAFRITGMLLHLWHGSHGAFWQLEQVFNPRAKWPPSPAYFLYYGGPGLGLVWLTLVCARRGWAKTVLHEAARVGRCSLAMFVAQAFLYYKGVSFFHLGYTPLWPAIFLLTLVPLYLLARVWDSHRLNRVLSVGLLGVLERLGITTELTVPQRN